MPVWKDPDRRSGLNTPSGNQGGGDNKPSRGGENRSHRLDRGSDPIPTPGSAPLEEAETPVEQEHQAEDPQDAGGEKGRDKKTEAEDGAMPEPPGETRELTASEFDEDAPGPADERPPDGPKPAEGADSPSTVAFGHPKDPQDATQEPSSTAEAPEVEEGTRTDDAATQGQREPEIDHPPTRLSEAGEFEGMTPEQVRAAAGLDDPEGRSDDENVQRQSDLRRMYDLPQIDHADPKQDTEVALDHQALVEANRESFPVATDDGEEAEAALAAEPTDDDPDGETQPRLYDPDEPRDDPPRPAESTPEPEQRPEGPESTPEPEQRPEGPESTPEPEQAPGGPANATSITGGGEGIERSVQAIEDAVKKLEQQGEQTDQKLEMIAERIADSFQQIEEQLEGNLTV